MKPAMRKTALVSVVLAMLLILCGAIMTKEDLSLGEPMMNVNEVDLSALDRVPETIWRKVAQQRIYFGHQSVGANILAGVEEILQRHPRIKLTLVEFTDPAQLDQPCLAHSRIGQNHDPQSKIDRFVELMKAGTGQRADIALFKLCYVDIEPQTNAKELARAYLDAVARLEQDLPGTSFIGVTSPLTRVESGLKTRLKKILGKPLWGYQENLRRSEFNEVLRQGCQDRRPLFDLAGIESTAPDGQATWVRVDGVKAPCLASAYTDDGGHLNQAGRLIAAREFLLELARVAEARSE